MGTSRRECFFATSRPDFYVIGQDINPSELGKFALPNTTKNRYGEGASSRREERFRSLKKPPDFFRRKGDNVRILGAPGCL